MHTDGAASPHHAQHRVAVTNFRTKPRDTYNDGVTHLTGTLLLNALPTGKLAEGSDGTPGLCVTTPLRGHNLRGR